LDDEPQGALEHGIDGVLARSEPPPPTNVRERRTAQSKTRRDDHSKEYLHDLKHAFQEAGVEQTGFLSEDQWRGCAIRFSLRDGRLTSDEFQACFRRIDANCDGCVEWDELVDFLILEMTCSGMSRVWF